jgi:hypothetical protein
VRDGGTMTVALADDPDMLDPTLARTLVGRMVFMSICEKLYDIRLSQSRRCRRVVELRGFEPLTPCMPLMLGYFTSPCATSPTHATEQVKGAAEGWVVGRRQVTCSAVSGKSLARAPCVVVFGTNAGAVVPAARDHLRLGHIRCIHLLGRFRVERRANGGASSVMAE